MNADAANQAGQARACALGAHAGQTDKAGRPYHEHLQRVAGRTTNEEARAVAWLHDTVEDTGTTLEALRSAGFSEAVIEAVGLLTRPREGTYQHYIRALGRSGNETAMSVKIADLRDHLEENPEAIPETLKERYRNALAHLEGRRPTGR